MFLCGRRHRLAVVVAVDGEQSSSGGSSSGSRHAKIPLGKVFLRAWSYSRRPHATSTLFGNVSHVAPLWIQGRKLLPRRARGGGGAGLGGACGAGWGEGGCPDGQLIPCVRMHGRSFHVYVVS